jgi:hypothetical protein
MYTVLLILLILLLIGALPPVGLHSYGWGPSGLVGVILIVLLILVLMGRV